MSLQYVTLPEGTRPIPEFLGYRIVDGGEVFSCWNTWGMTDRWHVKKPRKFRPGGHIQIKLKAGGVKRVAFVHCLVLESFVGPCPPGLECCHNDGNPANNFRYNLRWDTHESNVQDRFRHGTIVRGEDVNTAKLTEADIPDVFLMAKQGFSPTQIAARYGVTRENVYYILARKSWKHVPIPADLLNL